MCGYVFLCYDDVQSGISIEEMGIISSSGIIDGKFRLYFQLRVSLDLPAGVLENSVLGCGFYRLRPILYCPYPSTCIPVTSIA